MKTITIGRDATNQPIWHPAYQKCAAEFGFHPAVCAPAAANQKGAVENLVKFVKHNFLAGRSFYDDTDLAQESAAWLDYVNQERPSDATEQVPSLLLAEEQRKFGPLPTIAYNYGFFESVKVNRESLVAIATNRYSVPAHLVGCALTARIYPERIELFYGTECVASHPRQLGRHARIIVPEHFEPVFARKPRARVMVYRDWLVGLSPTAAAYVSELCRRRYAELEQQVTALYTLVQQVGKDAFLAALALAAEHEAYGVEYLSALLAQPCPQRVRAGPPAEVATRWPNLPPQAAVERDLAQYEQYVANRDGSQMTPTGGGP